MSISRNSLEIVQSSMSQYVIKTTVLKNKEFNSIYDLLNYDIYKTSKYFYLSLYFTACYLLFSFFLGIIKSLDERHRYFPHGTSHHIGLDVHDPGTYGQLQANMVITVEPGIYIPIGSDCDSKWHGIAVRIEDDILITENGPVNLSAEAPRTASGIERLMTKKSALNGLELPDLNAEIPGH